MSSLTFPLEKTPYASDSGLATVQDFIELTKPGVLLLVVFSSLTGMVLAPGSIHPYFAFCTLLAISLGAAAAAVFNMWYDRDIDVVMKRTQGRPIPAGRMAPQDALTFGILLTIASLTLMAFSSNLRATLLLAFSIFFYAVVYTIGLKRYTPQNIVIGGAAGAFPPMIGWVAVTGEGSVTAWILFLIIFLWTPPHFWTLALHKNEDYRVAKVPMLPLVAGSEATRWQIVLYSILMVLATALPYLLGGLGEIYGGSALLLGSLFLILSLRVWFYPSPRANVGLFLYSILYLFLLFASMIVDHQL